ncbi:hydrogen peroxide-inducible genes activator [Algivirga pacifica]|uniref:LysR substrate-binding domain-containing protein n=1 Tax=Algivirga pacifica TaxID=1162670 RepID=A0ABP9DRL0_9BACT
MNITLTQLEYLIAVEQHGSFSNAAEASFVTQPTLSMQIKKLEEFLGVTIFDRSKHPVTPTKVGKPIITQAYQIVREAKKIKDIVDQHKGIIGGELRVGIIPTLAPYLLPRFAGALVKEYQDVSLVVKEWQTEEILSALKNDRIDVGILVTPLKENGIQEMPLFYEELRVYTSKAHPFENQLEVDVADLQSPDIWLLSSGHCFRDQVINLCSESKDKMTNNLPIAYESGSLETLRKLVDKEGGFTLLPELAIDEFDEEGQERIRTFKDTRPVREVSLVYSKDFAKQSLLEALKKVIQKNVPKAMLKKERGNIVEWR